MSGSSFVLTLFCNDPVISGWALESGIDRIGPDLECLGKAARQASLDSRISSHTLEDVRTVAESLNGQGDLTVRINPLHAGSRREIDTIAGLGANGVILPFFKTVEEVDEFCRLVGGRMRTTLLLETIPAFMRLDAILMRAKVDEIHFGLQDLHLSAGLAHPGEVLVSHALEAAVDRVRQSGREVMVGGVARVGDNSLPLNADDFLAVQALLGSGGAFVSRSFMVGIDGRAVLKEEVQRLRSAYDRLRRSERAELEAARTRLLANWDPQRPADR
ncbi:aldolase/citrate lyase/malate synthase family protein [Maricaulis sp. CAU 1757]